MRISLLFIDRKSFAFPLLLALLPLIFTQCGKTTQPLSENEDILTEEPATNPADPDNQEDQEGQATGDYPNILFILADDLGLDPMPGYPIGGQKAFLPTLTQLANEGVRFTQAWSNPACTPTRASILTGKYGFRTGVLGVEQDNNIRPSERIIQQAMREQTDGVYRSSVIGKWHVTAGDAFEVPEAMGVDHYAGLFSGGVNDYHRWRFTTNGMTTTQNSYITTALTDLALEWINAQEQPWFCWLAYNAPHSPFHLPPNELHYQGNLASDEASIDQNPLPYYLAMIESLDTEIGRLLSGLSSATLENTLIVFMGDNGTPNGVVQSPYVSTKAKGSLYHGGVHVPLIVSGYGVERQGEEEEALVTAVDLYNTFLAAAGLSPEDNLDSQSFWPLLNGASTGGRIFNYAEIASNRANRSGYTISDGHHKYIRFNNGTEEFFDLDNDPSEDNNLLEQSLSSSAQNALNALQSKAAEIRQ